MKINRAIIVVFLLLANGHTQGSSEFYIASLQMPCYPPLGREAYVQGLAKVKIEVGKDGAVTSAEALEGNALLRSTAVANVQTWKFASGLGEDLSRLKTTVVFEYKLEGEPGWERCAARVIFDSFNRVEVFAHAPHPNSE